MDSNRKLKQQELLFNKRYRMKILHNFNTYWAGKKKQNIFKALKGKVNNNRNYCEQTTQESGNKKPNRYYC